MNNGTVLLLKHLRALLLIAMSMWWLTFTVNLNEFGIINWTLGLTLRASKEAEQTREDPENEQPHPMGGNSKAE